MTLNSINLRDKHYLKQVEELSEKLNIVPSDVVKNAIAEYYRKNMEDI